MSLSCPLGGRFLADGVRRFNRQALVASRSLGRRFLERRFLRTNFFRSHLFVRNCRTRQRFAGKKLDGARRSRRVRRSRGGQIRLRMTSIILLEVFEDVADVQESVAVQPDIDESRLHAGEDPSDSAFVDAADKRELFFALDVDFD